MLLCWMLGWDVDWSQNGELLEDADLWQHLDSTIGCCYSDKISYCFGADMGLKPLNLFQISLSDSSGCKIFKFWNWCLILQSAMAYGQIASLLCLLLSTHIYARTQSRMNQLWICGSEQMLSRLLLFRYRIAYQLIAVIRRVYWMNLINFWNDQLATGGRWDLKQWLTTSASYYPLIN